MKILGISALVVAGLLAGGGLLWKHFVIDGTMDKGGMINPDFVDGTDDVHILDGDHTYVDNEKLLQVITGTWSSEDGHYAIKLDSDCRITLSLDGEPLLNDHIQFTYLITSTFRQAYQNRNAPQSLMFHSDQGAQYTSKTFCKLLHINKVVQSFSAPGQLHDNAVMESFFSFMKREEIYRTQYKSEQQFAKSVDYYIEFYNTQRPHSTFNYKTPDQFEAIYEGKKKSVD